MMSHMAVGKVTAPMILDDRTLMIRLLSPPSTSVKIAMRSSKYGTIRVKLTRPLFSSTFHLLLYTAITVQVAGMAKTVRMRAMVRNTVCEMPDVSTVPSHINAAIMISVIASLFMERLEFSYLDTVVSRSV